MIGLRLLLVVAVAASVGACPSTRQSDPSFKTDLGRAAPLQPTCYDDGAACPGGCDAHVVTHRRDNGTARVHSPDSVRPSWQRCASGQECEICLGDDPEDCFAITHRGPGPESGRADFTTSFWIGACVRHDLPVELESECQRIGSDADRLERRISCLADSDPRACAAVVPDAGEAARARARVERCLAEHAGSWRCYYPAPARKLSPGACSNGAVNADRWDCCTGEPFHDACVTGCQRYYLAPSNRSRRKEADRVGRRAARKAA